VGPESRQFASYLDFGCGNQEISVEVAKGFKIPLAFAADVHPPAQKQNPLISYVQVVEDRLAIESHVVELVTCFMSLHHLENFERSVQEIVRIMKNGGYLFIREHDVGPADFRLIELLTRYHEKFSDHQGSFTKFWGRKQLKTKLKSFGFENLRDIEYRSIVNEKQIYHSLFQLRLGRELNEAKFKNDQL